MLLISVMSLGLPARGDTSMCKLQLLHLLVGFFRRHDADPSSFLPEPLYHYTVMCLAAQVHLLLLQSVLLIASQAVVFCL